MHLASIIEAARRGGTAHNDALTFAQLAERFIADKQLSKQETTSDLYARQLRCHILGPLGSIKARKLTDDHITTMLN